MPGFGGWPFFDPVVHKRRQTASLQLYFSQAKSRCDRQHKLAVMPQSRTDVLELLAATAEMADRHPETPIITMSMGALGAVSRLSGEALGSAMTFANPGQASAPGQVSLEVVNEVLDALHL